MAIARMHLMDLRNSGTYHCISECARQLFLCGSGIRDRKKMANDRLAELANIFLIDVAAYAFLDNHWHSLLDTHPELAEALTESEVAWRWFLLYPKSIHRWAKPRAAAHEDLKDQRDASGVLTDDAAVEVVARDTHLVEMLRQRLSNISWMMKIIKQEIALTANREDGVRGHFWQGRFKSIKILDGAARLQVMVYIDLNLIRADMASTPETSNHTSVQDRIRVKLAYQNGSHLQEEPPPELVKLFREGEHPDADHGCWLAPIQKSLSMILSQYLTTVDQLGRMVRGDKRGSIPADLPPILERLGLTEDHLTLAAGMPSPLYGSVAGTPESCAKEALTRGIRNVVNVFRPRKK